MGKRLDTRAALGVCVLAALLAACGRGGPAVHAKPQSIQFGVAPALTAPGTGTVSAAASSGLAVTYSSMTPSICSVASTGTVTALAAGTCVIAASQDGNTEFAPAAQATININVAVNPLQTIGFGTVPVLGIYGSARVSATSTSGLPVSYSSLTPAVCTVDVSGVVTDLLSGTCTIAADQAGNATYNPAPQATQTITVPAWAGPATVPGAPAEVKAAAGIAANTVSVGFIGPSTSGGSPITGYTVTSNPAGITVSGIASPLTVNCPVSCAGYSFAVNATNVSGVGLPSAWANVLTNYNVVATFFEPGTQPNDTIFTGSFTLDSTTGTVTNLKGILTESMTGPPMITIPLAYQLSAVSDGAGGLLVTTFALNTTNTFYGGGFTPGSSGLYYGFPTTPNPAAGGVGNSYAMIYVNLADPLAPLSAAQINKLAYADCAAGGMMGDVCMTGFGGVGTMGGYPVSQLITRQ